MGLHLRHHPPCRFPTLRLMEETLAPNHRAYEWAIVLAGPTDSLQSSGRRVASLKIRWIAGSEALPLLQAHLIGNINSPASPAGPEKQEKAS